jgi:hypothetical protein
MVCLCSVMCVDAALDEPVLNWCVAMYRMYWSIGHVCAKVLFCHWIVLWCIVFVCGCIFLFLLLNYSDSTVFAYFQIELPMFGLFRVKSFYAFFLCEKYFLSITKYLNVIHVWQKKSLSNPSIIYIFWDFSLNVLSNDVIYTICTFQKSEVQLQTIAIQDCEVILNKYILLWRWSTVVSDLWRAESWS